MASVFASATFARGTQRIAPIPISGMKVIQERMCSVMAGEGSCRGSGEDQPGGGQDGAPDREGGVLLDAAGLDEAEGRAEDLRGHGDGVDGSVDEDPVEPGGEGAAEL